MKLIDKDEIGFTGFEIVMCNNYEEAFKLLCQKIDNASIIEAEPIVRCKDCAFWQDDWETSAHDKNWHYCSQNDTNFYFNEYCSRGERKEDA